MGLGDKILNKDDCKPGERWLVRERFYYGEPFEIEIIEWSPSGAAVKVKYASGYTAWLERSKPYIVERLSAASICSNKPGGWLKHASPDFS